MSSSGGGETKSTTMNYSPEESARRAAVMDQATQLYTNGQLSGTWGTAAPVAQSAAGATGDAMKVQAAQTQGGQASAANAGLQYGLTGAMDVNNNPYLQSAMAAAIRPQQEALTQSLQQVGSAAQAQGAYGGSRQGIAEALALEKGQQAIGDTVAKMGSDAYTQGQQTFRTALGLAPQVQAMQTVPAETVQSVGAGQEERAQALADYLASKAAWDNEAQSRALQNYANLVLGSGGSMATTTGTTPKTNTTLSTLGTLGSLGMMAMML